MNILNFLPRRHLCVAALSLSIGLHVAGAFAQEPLAPLSTKHATLLQWDAEMKEQHPSAGQAKANFKFWFTNSSAAEIIIQSANTVCQCTVAKLPQQPWAIPPGGSGALDVSMELAGKSGQIEKPVYVKTSAGEQILRARVLLPTSAPADFSARGTDAARLNNLRQAAVDRQVVFKNQECAKCHAEPARGKSDGRELYAAVCAICHDSAHRAPMVPDLRTPRRATDATYWHGWISQSRPGSLMPAFAESEGGPLTAAQIDALARYLAETIPGELTAARADALRP